MQHEYCEAINISDFGHLRCRDFGMRTHCMLSQMTNHVALER